MSIFDIVGKKIAVNCRTKEEADAFIRLAIDCNLANNWEQNGNYKFEEYGEKLAIILTRVLYTETMLSDIARLNTIWRTLIR